MKTLFYPRLAWDGLRKNRQLSLPYLLTCICMVSMFYILSFLASEGVLELIPCIGPVIAGIPAVLLALQGGWIRALWALAVLLIIISYALISNSVRLGVYARRFTIHTMKLVGAPWSFIRRPFLWRSIFIGIVASLLACGVLGAIVYTLYQYQPGAEELVTVRELIIMAVSVFVFGFVIMLLCTLLSVNKFLRMTAGELYKI